MAQHKTLRRRVVLRSLLLVLVSLLQLAAAQVPWRALYSGALTAGATTPTDPGENVVLDVSYLENGNVYVRAILPARSSALTGVGTRTNEGQIVVYLDHLDTGPSPSFALDFDAERDPLTFPPADGEASDTPHALLKLVITEDWSDDGANASAALAFLGLAGDTIENLSGTMDRIAQYTTLTVQEGRIDVSASYPRFSGAQLAPLSESFEELYYGRVINFVRDGRANSDENALGWGWSNHDYLDLIGAAGPYVSLLASTYVYTGGAHPNTYYVSYLYDTSTSQPRLLDLTELFNAGALTELAAMAATDLLAQEAQWLVENPAALTPEQLSVFGLSPLGLHLVFEPYSVGPYVQGVFEVIVTYDRLAQLVPADGVIARFAALGR